MSYIYGIIERSSGKYLYIGSTTRDPKLRQNEHFKKILRKKHKIKKLNTYNVDEDLYFEVLCTLDTDCSLIINMMESFYNDLLHPLNKIVISGFRGSSVTLARSNNKELCKEIIETIKKYY